MLTFNPFGDERRGGRAKLYKTSVGSQPKRCPTPFPHPYEGDQHIAWLYAPRGGSSEGSGASASASASANASAICINVAATSAPTSSGSERAKDVSVAATSAPTSSRGGSAICVNVASTPAPTSSGSGKAKGVSVASASTPAPADATAATLLTVAECVARLIEEILTFLDDPHQPARDQVAHTQQVGERLTRSLHAAIAQCGDNRRSDVKRVRAEMIDKVVEALQSDGEWTT